MCLGNGECEMAKSKSKETSNLLAGYIRTIMCSDPAGKLSSITEYPKEIACRVYEGTKTPRWDQLMLILDYYGANIDDVYELAEQDSIIKFDYWNNLYPKEEPIQNIRFLLKELMQEKNLTTLMLAKKIQIQSSYISSLLSGAYPVSYSVLAKIATVLEETPASILNKFKGRGYLGFYRQQFSDMVKNARVDRGYSIETASKVCMLSAKTYIKIENGEMILTKYMLTRLCKGLGIDIKLATELASKSRLMLQTEEFNEYIGKSDRYGKIDEDANYDIDSVVEMFAAYKNIQSNQFGFYSNDILVILILAINNENEKYRGELIQYLKGLGVDKGREIYKKLMLVDLPDPDITLSQAFSEYKSFMGYSFLEISKISGVSKGYISNKNQKGDFDLCFIEKVYPVVNLPFAFGIELYIRKMIKDKNIIRDESAPLNTLTRRLNERSSVKFGEKMVMTEDLVKVCNTIFSTETAIDKYYIINGIMNK